MGLDSTACYRLHNVGVDLAQTRAFLTSLDIHYAGLISHYVFTPDGRLDEWSGLPPGIRQEGERFASLEEDWEFFAQAVASGTLSLNCTMRHKEFQFTLGFVAAPHGSYILLRFEDNDIYDMGNTLPVYGLDARQFFTRLYQAFSAQSFVYATDVYFEDLLALVQGTFLSGDIETRPWMTIAAPRATADLLRADEGRDLLVEGTSIISRNFFGAPNLA